MTSVTPARVSRQLLRLSTGSGRMTISQLALRLFCVVYLVASLTFIVQIGRSPLVGESLEGVGLKNSITTNSSLRGPDWLARANLNSLDSAEMQADPGYPANYEGVTIKRGNRVAAIITNYNMLERTDALVEAIKKHVKWEIDIIVVDNGSEEKYVSRHTMVRVAKNVQTCHGWLMGLHYAQALMHHQRERYGAYWMLITSAAIPDQRNMDILTPMMMHLEENPNTVAVHPALTDKTTTQWNHLKKKGTVSTRKTWMVDNIAALYRGDWFDSIGWFDPNLTFAWGIDVETSWLARRDGRDIVVHQEVFVEKITDVGYKMKRMGMSKEDRRGGARAETCEVLTEKYGTRWPQDLFYDPEDLGQQLVDHWKKLCGFDKFDETH